LKGFKINGLLLYKCNSLAQFVRKTIKSQWGIGFHLGPFRGVWMTPLKGDCLISEKMQKGQKGSKRSKSYKKVKKVQKGAKR
jgi:hypothetical protein